MNRIDKTKIRIIYYTLFSRLLTREVDEQTIDIIKKGCESDELMSELFKLTNQWGEFKDKTSKNMAEMLAVEYVDTFILKLVPYESFYTSENLMIESGSENSVLQFYKEYGFEADLIAARVVSGDHIGLELEFMMNLIKHELEALEDNNETYANSIIDIQKRFLKEHLLSFAFHFLPALASCVNYPFYKDVAEVALEFIFSDYEEISNQNV